MRGSCVKRGWVASEPQTEQRQGSVGLPDAHRYRGQGMHVPGERAQARTLGGTAKQPFALNEGGRLFLNPWELCRVPGSGLCPQKEK